MFGRKCFILSEASFVPKRRKTVQSKSVEKKTGDRFGAIGFALVRVFYSMLLAISLFSKLSHNCEKFPKHISLYFTNHFTKGSDTSVLDGRLFCDISRESRLEEAVYYRWYGSQSSSTLAREKFMKTPTLPTQTKVIETI